MRKFSNDGASLRLPYRPLSRWRGEGGQPYEPFAGTCGQNVIDQLLMYPVSPAALSFTRSFQMPLSASLDRFFV